ncbi:MAG: hypothetical protein GXY88_09290 [Tissierellia bacterium]|nr:hypothetical protein [Tissierellia bacterium]
MYEQAVNEVKLFLKALGYEENIAKEQFKDALIENLKYDDGRWSIKLKNEKLGEIGTIEFAVSVVGTKDVKLWEDNYNKAKEEGLEFKVFTYTATNN